MRKVKKIEKNVKKKKEKNKVKILLSIVILSKNDFVEII